MSNSNIKAVLDSNPKIFKPILYTTYHTITKYILNIVYEDETTKEVELITNDQNKIYRVTFKRNGELITVTGAISNIHIIPECNMMCDLPNNIMDGKDLLIEIDCSSRYKCDKVTFYLKDIRDIIDLTNEQSDESEEDTNIPHTIYPIYLNGYSCDNVIPCKVFEDNGIFKINLSSQITKLGIPLTKDQYSDFDIFTLDFDPEISLIKPKENETTDNVILNIPEELLDGEITLILRYFITEVNHAVFDEFIIIPSKEIIEIDDSKSELTRAVSTQDTQYLGDGIKPALGVGGTPGYKEYKNKKSYNDSVLE